ncbi:Transposase [Chryseobacterium indoltheticum]|uniref:Transposase n=1 Tax=Chryseobacterium indoltheticum TaxID=254 RepID=A0A381FNH9_9FLAO|nr:Transposase [Chryseobacterium indoltheticum]SUX47499.1 Transposase [Chryseobacterium indoltheticum]SUX48097.1 Transposase [Chryseobacterium indoltheticum]SUX48116.1 Transposase [Chryseobacterium indoltheticum]SUX48425.1 Transposase [Chryseobacterium indoltheticum]
MDCPQKVRHFLGAFFMKRKEKFSVAFKLDCIELHQNSYRSIDSIATEKGFNESNLRKWISFYNKYGISGLRPRKNKSYSLKFKLKVLKAIHTEFISQREACVRFDIPAQSTVLNWQRDYEKGGILGLENKPIGRPKIMSDYKRKKRKSDKPLTREEELLLENERLRAENDFLKKLDALTLKKNKQKPSKN